MLQNAWVTAFTISELLRENQHKGRRGGGGGGDEIGYFVYFEFTPVSL